MSYRDKKGNALQSRDDKNISVQLAILVAQSYARQVMHKYIMEYVHVCIHICRVFSYTQGENKNKKGAWKNKCYFEKVSSTAGLKI